MCKMLQLQSCVSAQDSLGPRQTHSTIKPRHHTPHIINSKPNSCHIICFIDFMSPLTSSITTQICFTHSIIDWGVPAMVMARSVELGSMSPATCT